MEFAPLHKVDLVGAALDQIRDAILLGRLAPGDLLPSERELALQLGVNRTTVREVMSRLELLGLIDRRHGRRCQVLDYRRSGNLALSVHLARLGVPGVGRSVIESSVVVYAGTAALAADRATDDDVAALRSSVVALDAAVAAADRDAVVAADRDVHLAVAAAAHSVVLELMVSNFYRAFDGVHDASGTVKRSIVEILLDLHRAGRRLPHGALVEAIATHDAEAARAIATAMVNGAAPPPSRRPPGRTARH